MQTVEWKLLDTTALDVPLEVGGWDTGSPPVLGDGVLLVRQDFSSSVALHFDSLSQEESERAARFKFPEHQQRYRTGRSLLREVLARQLSCGAKSLKIATGEHGKPYLADDAGGLHFNVAHTDKTLLIACTYGQEIGVDVEKTDRIAAPELDRMYRFVCHQDEIEIWESCPEKDRPVLFTRLWTMKEALLKARGSGLMTEPRKLNISALLGQGCGLLNEETYITGGPLGESQLMALALAQSAAV